MPDGSVSSTVASPTTNLNLLSLKTTFKETLPVSSCSVRYSNTTSISRDPFATTEGIEMAFKYSGARVVVTTVAFDAVVLSSVAGAETMRVAVTAGGAVEVLVDVGSTF